MATKDSFLLRVLAPAGVQVDEQVHAVILPSDKGQMGVLPGHVNYSGVVGTGTLEYNPILKDTTKCVVVSGGFCTFSEDTLTIIADKVDLPEETEAEDCRKRIEELKKSLASLNGYDSEYEVISTEITRFEALSKLVK